MISTETKPWRSCYVPDMRKRPAIPRLDGGTQTVLLVEDVQRSVAFYAQKLMLKAKDGDTDRFAEFDTGDGGVLVLVKRDGSIAPMVMTADDAVGLTFTIAAEAYDIWKKWLASREVPIERETKWIHGGKSLYMRDPDGRRIEFKTPAVIVPPKLVPLTEKKRED